MLVNNNNKSAQLDAYLHNNKLFGGQTFTKEQIDTKIKGGLFDNKTFSKTQIDNHIKGGLFKEENTSYEQWKQNLFKTYSNKQ